MARVAGLKTKLSRHRVDDETAREIIGDGNLVEIIERMQRLLAPEMVCRILDESACGTSKRELGGLRRVEADTLQGRIDAIALLGDFHSGWDIGLHGDDAVAAGWAIEENGAFACVCSAAVKGKRRVSDLAREGRAMPLAYCLCCAGHCRRHLERLLGLRLETREVVSSPINSKGQAPCRFILDIV